MSHRSCEWQVIRHVTCHMSHHMTCQMREVSFAKEPYKRDYILQKRPIVLRSLIIVATPYQLLLPMSHRSCEWQVISHVTCHMGHHITCHLRELWVMTHVTSESWLSHHLPLTCESWLMWQVSHDSWLTCESWLMWQVSHDYYITCHSLVRQDSCDKWVMTHDSLVSHDSCDKWVMTITSLATHLWVMTHVKSESWLMTHLWVMTHDYHITCHSLVSHDSWLTRLITRNE